MASLMNQDEILLTTQCYEEVNFFVALCKKKVAIEALNLEKVFFQGTLNIRWFYLKIKTHTSFLNKNIASLK